MASKDGNRSDETALNVRLRAVTPDHASSSATSPRPPSDEFEGWRPTDWEGAETPKDRLFSKFKEQPLVPAGCALTMGALLVASYHLRKGNRPQLNRALRWRIYFHGLTMVSAVGGLWYYDSNKAAPVPPPAASTPSSSSLSPSTPEADQSQSAARQVYQSIAKAPGRPPTNSQVSKQQHRQVSTRQEWEERFRAAQDREDAQHDQKKLEEALLKGVDLRQSLDDEVAAAEEKRRSDIQFKRDNRPVIGQDGRDRRQPSS